MKNFFHYARTLGLGLVLSYAGAAQAELKTAVFTAGGPGFQVTSTLISGENEAVLIDAQFTLSEAHRLTAKVLESGKELKTIFITHGHPDHYFGLEVLKQAFPNVQILAKPSVVAEIEATHQKYVENWQPMYGDNLTTSPVVPRAFHEDSLMLEGETLKFIEMAPGEIESSTIVHIPSINTVIAGDIVNNGVHVWMAETNPQRRQNWLTNLQRIQDLQPEVVVAGHKRAELADSPESIQFTATYIRDFEAALGSTDSAPALVEKMMATYSHLALPVILEIAAKAVHEGGHDH